MKDLDSMSHSNVHYLVAIHALSDEFGVARVTDIAERLSLTKGTVSSAIAKLKRGTFIICNPDKTVKLSKLGHSTVHNFLSTRKLFTIFLRDFLNVSSKNAELDSCLVEHLLSDETKDKLFLFLKEGNGLRRNSTTSDFIKCRSFGEFRDAFK